MKLTQFAALAACCITACESPTRLVSPERFPSADFIPSITATVDWTPRTPGPQRWEPAFAFLPAPSCKALSFGGIFQGVNSSETHLFDPASATWTLLTFAPNKRPIARRGAGLNWDSSRNRAVLFGGINNGGSSLQDTWVFDRANLSWTALSKACNKRTPCPPARSHHGQEYSSALGGTFVFGGLSLANGLLPLNDAWVLGPAGWVSLATNAGPSPRFNFGMALDAPSGEFVVYGGVGSNGTKLSDTWLFDPATRTWTLVPVGPAPTASDGVAMSFSPRLGAVVLHSGLNASGQETNETWAFDMADRQWVQITTTNSPPPRAYARMTTNTCDGSNILFGTPGATTGSPPPAAENYTWILQ